MPVILVFVCYAIAFGCFLVTALTRGKYEDRVSLLPLGLAFWVLVPLVNSVVALD